MSTFTIAPDAISPAVLRLVGRCADDAELRAFLESCGGWPLAAFAADEFNVGFTDKARGFELLFEDAATVKHPAAEGKPARAALFVGAYFFNQDTNDFQRFAGALPFGIRWTDSSIDLVARFGEPRKSFTSKKSGALTAQRWPIDGLLLTVGYRDGAIEDVYVGIT